MKPTLKFVRLTPTAKIPWKAHTTDSGYDICADEDVMVYPYDFKKIKTGIAAVIPEGYELQVRPRSGLAAKNGVYSVFGTVDEAYRGEICIILSNPTVLPFLVHRGDRLAQLVIAKREECEVTEGNPEDLTATDRGADGFGSTGVQ